MKPEVFDYNSTSILWNKKLSLTAFGFTLALIFFMVTFFLDQIISPLWIMITVVVVLAYFYLINNVYQWWKEKEQVSFVYNLFFAALIARLLYMGVITLLAQIQSGQPFYLGAVDAITNSNQAAVIGSLIRSTDYNAILPTLQSFYVQPDNWGPPFLFGVIYAVFGEYPLIAKIFTNIMGAGTVIFTYKTARLLWNDNVARLAGIMFAFFPLALFYSSVLLKEEFVVFFIMVASYNLLLSLSKTKFSISSSLFIVFSIVALFFFRTAAGILIIFVSFLAILLYHRKGLAGIYVSILGIIILLSSIYFITIVGDGDFYLERIETYDSIYETRIETVSQEQSYADLVGIPVFTMLSFISPFPSMVALDAGTSIGHNYRYYYIPGLIIWNFVIYFGLIGLWKSVRYNIRQTILIVGFGIGYILILSLTGFFTRVRFNYNAMPMLFIMIAVGLQYRQYHKFWPIYLIGASALIIAWNIFRLAGRGLI